MSAKYYTLTEIKQLALDSANVMGLPDAYSYSDADKAYNYAAGVCGFANPLSSDENYSVKQRWLLEGMRLYFLRDVLARNVLQFDVGDLKLGMVAKRLSELVALSEEAFTNAKESPDTAHLFMNAASHFGQVVYKPGITDDAVGQPVDPDKI